MHECGRRCGRGQPYPQINNVAWIVVWRIWSQMVHMVEVGWWWYQVMMMRLRCCRLQTMTWSVACHGQSWRKTGMTGHQSQATAHVDLIHWPVRGMVAQAWRGKIRERHFSVASACNWRPSVCLPLSTNQILQPPPEKHRRKKKGKAGRCWRWKMSGNSPRAGLSVFGCRPLVPCVRRGWSCEGQKSTGSCVRGS